MSEICYLIIEEKIFGQETLTKIGSIATIEIIKQH